jgi:putative transposase
MDGCSYASDLNDAEWALLEPLVPRSHPAGRRQTYPLRRIVDAIFYLLRTGAQWRMLPHEYPPRSAVFYHYAQWREDGTWEHVTQVLRESYRRTVGRPNRQRQSSTVSRSRPLRWADRVAMMAAKRSRAASAIFWLIRKEIC